MVDTAMGALTTRCDEIPAWVGVDPHRLNANCLRCNQYHVTECNVLQAICGTVLSRSRLIPVPRK